MCIYSRAVSQGTRSRKQTIGIWTCRPDLYSRMKRLHFGNCALECRGPHQSRPPDHTALQSGMGVQTAVHRDICWIICAPLLRNKHCFLEYLSAYRTQREKDRESIYSKPLPNQCFIKSNSMTRNHLKASTSELPMET